jgi:ABC-type glycerol-3-phosphate transport system substrate-binding protein
VEVSPQFATVREQGEYPSPRYGSPFYFDLGTVFNQHLLSLTAGEITPQEAVDLIQAQGQQLIDDYWAKAA